MEGDTTGTGIGIGIPPSPSGKQAMKQLKGDLEAADAAIRGLAFASNGAAKTDAPSNSSKTTDFPGSAVGVPANTASSLPISAVGLPIVDAINGINSSQQDRTVTEVAPVRDTPDRERSNNNEGLAVAAPVTDDPRDIEHARPVIPANEVELEEKRKQRNFWIAIGILTAVAVIAFLVIALSALKEKESISLVPKEESQSNLSDDTGNATSTPPKLPQDILTALLPAYTLPKIELDYAPQARAFKWVAEDPNFASYSDKRLQQRFALATFYYSTNGESWGPDWLNITQHECQWDFFMPDGFNYNRVRGPDRYELQFIDGPCVPLGYNSSNTNMPGGGEYPDDYLYLTLWRQEVTGIIPPEITMLTSLKLVQLDYTTMGGPIPTILTNLTGLRELHVFNTAFTGTIPTELALLTELRTLSIGGTEEIRGTLPSEFGRLSNIQVLQIGESGVTGTIPLEYSGLRPLLFQLYQNRLSGTIPTELGLMSTVEWIMLERNDFTGTVPSELGALEKAMLIYLHENDLSGTIATELGLLTSTMRQIYLHTNSLTGTIPTELGQLSEIFWRLRFDSNNLTGTIPSELGACSLLHSFGVHNNMLTGIIPPEVAALPRMEYFRASNNNLSGMFPREFLLDTGSKMIQFWLEHSSISGSIPTEVGKWTKLVQFRVSGNNLTGRIPSELGTSSKLKIFHAESNLLTGQIPSEIGNITTLKEFSVGDNRLTGTVPRECGFLVTDGALTLLNLTNNDGLFGTIPDSVCSIYDDPSLINILEFDCGILCGCHCPCENVSALALQNGVVVAPGKAGQH
ncbi:LRR receptor-like serine threonine-protein kinase [Seminavis robusta]|uniref:LRR receptor-like serine threonine-protein kinase n=1 Tax=Seminavis robusta TaxID=568900 RepID=A0A9N8DSR2_9STRA|nr:LRR receptor-like serine threonine-protein kinase [Seminavis robusta]|eukprot:Sro225_g091700.1 LRR receptor-like serine threonine-protein kinase (802) ;mRNA; r:5732-8401